MKKIKVFTPATVANVACGFDILGFALNNPGDEIILKSCGTPGVTISKITGDNGRLTRDAMKNTASVSLLAYLKHIQYNQGFEIEIHKKMPIGSGLGSSAASAAAGIFAANMLLGQPLKTEELLPFAMEGEKVACGFAHADNVAPALLGGFVIIRSYEPLDVIKIPAPEKLFCTIIYPKIEIRTKDARNMLKKEIPLQDAIIQWGNVAGLIAGLCNSDYNLIGRSLQDVIAEPIRSVLIPGFYEMKAASLKAGSLGCSISGSGPSVFALSTSLATAKKTGQAMQKVLFKSEIESEIYISGINQEGARVIDDYEKIL